MAPAGLRVATIVCTWAVALPRLAFAKQEVGSGRLGGPVGRWQYVSKFGYAIGTGSYSVRLRMLEAELATDRHGSLDFHLFLDEEWATVETLPPCQRASLARAKFPLRPGVAGDWGRWFNGTLYQTQRPHIWYFAITDCNGFFNRSTPIEFEFQARQFDESELSLEMRYLPMATSASLVCLTMLLLEHARRCQRFKQSAGALHPVVWVLTLALGMQYIGQVFHFLHLERYDEDGEGIWAFDALAEMLNMLSQAVHAILLIAIAQGYTLSCPRMDELRLMKPTAIAVMAIHASLVYVGKLQGDFSAAHRHHAHCGPVGWALLAIRVLLFVWFGNATRSTRERSGMHLQTFLDRFGFAGSVYLLAYPFVYVVAQVLAPYLRHPFMQVALLATQTMADLWLAALFLTRGAYFKVSELSASVLPGGTARGMLLKID